MGKAQITRPGLVCGQGSEVELGLPASIQAEQLAWEMNRSWSRVGCSPSLVRFTFCPSTDLAGCT